VHPPTRAIEKVHKKNRGTARPHVLHSWQIKAKTKHKWVPQYAVRVQVRQGRQGPLGQGDNIDAVAFDFIVP
jgi:hypothetical protein